jgi:hypothetical protein
VQAALDEFAARATPLALWSAERTRAVADGTDLALQAYGDAQGDMAAGTDRGRTENERFAPRIAW